MRKPAIERPIYSEKLKSYTRSDIIRIITGAWHCGKSSMLLIYKAWLEAQYDADSVIYLLYGSSPYCSHSKLFLRNISITVKDAGKTYQRPWLMKTPEDANSRPWRASTTISRSWYSQWTIMISHAMAYGIYTFPVSWWMKTGSMICIGRPAGCNHLHCCM